MSISAMKQALAAMGAIRPYEVVDHDPIAAAITALRTAIAEAEEKDADEWYEQLLWGRQEPVAWFIQYEYRHEFLWREPTAYEKNSALEIKPLYTAPVHALDISQERVDETAKREHEFEEMVKRGTKAWADTPDDWVDDLRGGAEKREWVGLTDEEIDKLRQSNSTGRGAGWRFDFSGFARAIEAKLKEKNT